VPLLVDGDNLLGTWPGRPRSDAARRELAGEILRYARRRRRRALVVFDGSSPPEESLGPDVRFSGPGRTADDLILALLREQADRRGWTVVTSDRSLGDRCRHLEASVERCDRFRRRLGEPPGGEKPDREEDLAYWIAQFGKED
jgi:YacP-like NYN domain